MFLKQYQDKSDFKFERENSDEVLIRIFSIPSFQTNYFFSQKLKEDYSAAFNMINQDFFNVMVKHSDSKILSFTSS